MRALVFELDHSGHRMQYVRMLIEALGPLSKELVLFTSVEAAASEEYKTHLDGITSSFRVETRPQTSMRSSQLTFFIRYQRHWAQEAV